MHSGFMQFAAFDQDAVDNQQFLAKGKLSMPVLAVGGEKSFGATMAKIMRFAASNVREGVIQAPAIGSWRKTRPRRSPWYGPSLMKGYNGTAIGRAVDELRAGPSMRIAWVRRSEWLPKKQPRNSGHRAASSRQRPGSEIRAPHHARSI